MQNQLGAALTILSLVLMFFIAPVAFCGNEPMGAIILFIVGAGLLAYALFTGRVKFLG